MITYIITLIPIIIKMVKILIELRLIWIYGIMIEKKEMI